MENTQWLVLQVNIVGHHHNVLFNKHKQRNYGDHDEGKGISKENDIILLGKYTFNMFPSEYKECFSSIILQSYEYSYVCCDKTFCQN